MVSRNVESSSANLEFDAAVGWWKTQLKSVLCDETITKFECSLRRCIFDKLTKHWFPDTPRKGQAYRSISLDRIGRLDPVLRTACHDAKITNIFDYFPYVDSIIMWIDPGEVAVKTFWNYAKCGTEEIVYKKEGSTTASPQNASKTDIRKEAHKTNRVVPRIDPKMFSVKKVEIPKQQRNMLRPYGHGHERNVQPVRSMLLHTGIWSTTAVGDGDDWDNYICVNV